MADCSSLPIPHTEWMAGKTDKRCASFVAMVTAES